MLRRPPQGRRFLKRRLSRLLRLPLVAGILFPLLGFPGAPAAAWRWDKAEGSSLALIGPAGEVWRFRYGSDLDQAYFHPLSTTEGLVLTADRPPDHIWHHGLWFSWKYIDKVNYWEVEAQTGRPAGRTSWRVAALRARRNGTARITLDLDYRPVGTERPVLTERRTLDISAPGKDGVYTIDWTGTFEAAKDLVLDRTPLPGEPGGQVNGGYAGLALRLAGGLQDLRLMTDQGPASEFQSDRYRGRHRGLDDAGLEGGSAAGVAILDHPSNPRTPTAWYAVHTAVMSFFNPALLSLGPLPMRAGERMTLRYRILIHPGRWDAARLRAESARFAQAR
jgi:hypothetical protein